MGMGGRPGRCPFGLRVPLITSPGSCPFLIRVPPITSPGSCPFLIGVLTSLGSCPLLVRVLPVLTVQRKTFEGENFRGFGAVRESFLREILGAWRLGVGRQANVLISIENHCHVFAQVLPA